MRREETAGDLQQQAEQRAAANRLSSSRAAAVSIGESTAENRERGTAESTREAAEEQTER